MENMLIAVQDFVNKGFEFVQSQFNGGVDMLLESGHASTVMIGVMVFMLVSAVYGASSAVKNIREYVREDRAIAAERQDRADREATVKTLQQEQINENVRMYVQGADRKISTWGDMQDRSFTA